MYMHRKKFFWRWSFFLWSYDWWFLRRGGGKRGGVSKMADVIREIDATRPWRWKLNMNMTAILSPRYTQPPADLWPWFEEYLDDEEVRIVEPIPLPCTTPHISLVPSKASLTLSRLTAKLCFREKKRIDWWIVVSSSFTWTCFQQQWRLINFRCFWLLSLEFLNCVKSHLFI